MLRYKVDEYRVWEKGKEYSVLKFPFIEHMWAYDCSPEEYCYMIDGPAEVFSALKYAFAILCEASDKIIYFPCKQAGIGKYYSENFHLVICTPKVQLRRSLWVRIRRKMNRSTWKGKYVLRYSRKKLEDYCKKKLFFKMDLGIKHLSKEGEYGVKPEVRKKMDHDSLQEVVGDTLFIVMGKEEAYFHHYHICKDLEDLKDVYPSFWSSIGWIITERAIREMYETKKQEDKKLQMKNVELGGDMK